jgi:probable poly-beta-1,6-N-acetyl-D-glucosamine export protein
MSSLKPQYNPVIDLLRVIAILAVVAIHTTTKTIQAVSGDLHLVPYSLFFNQTVRFAVPLFFLISGFVLELSSPPDLNYWAYLKKRLSRILVPYLFWSFVYYFFVYPGNISGFPHALLAGTASYQLYFIPTLLVFYLIFPLFHRYYRILANRWVLLALGILQLFFLYHDYYLTSYPIFYPLNIALLNFYVFILGIVASRHQSFLQKTLQKFRYLLSITTGFLIAYISYEGWTRYYATGNYLAFYSQWRPTVFFYTIFLFLTLYYFLGRLRRLPLALIKTLSSLSFFVFFIHVLVLEIIWRYFGLYLFNLTSGYLVRHFWYDPLFFTLIAGLSFLIAYLCHKIPFLSRLTG